jgi:hypothetical protein
LPLGGWHRLEDTPIHLTLLWRRLAKSAVSPVAKPASRYSRRADWEIGDTAGLKPALLRRPAALSGCSGLVVIETNDGSWKKNRAGNRISGAI